MSDIVEILRNYIPGENEDYVAQRTAEAADEIELLRQKLAFAEFEWNRATQSWKEAEARAVTKREWLFNDAEAIAKRADWYNAANNYAGLFQQPNLVQPSSINDTARALRLRQRGESAKLAKPRKVRRI